MQDESNWIKWDGGERPVDGLVDIKTRYGLVEKGVRAETLRWHHMEHVLMGGDIVAYRRGDRM